MMKIKHKIPLILLSATFLTVVILSYSTYSNENALIESAKHNDLQTVATLIQNDLSDQSNSAASKVELIISRPDVQKAFREGNREELLRIMAPVFLEQKNKFGVRESQFNLPPATVFLRLHNPKTFGDDASGYREMLLMAIKNKKTYQGIEVGRSGVNIRAANVIEDPAGVIGTFEVGMSFGTILEDLKKNTSFNGAIFIDDALMTKVATSRQRSSQERIFGDLQGIGATDWGKILPYVNTNLLSTVNDVTLITKNINGVDYGMVLLPLLDFKNNQIGVIVAISDFTMYQTQLRVALVANISLALFQLLFLFGVIIMTFRILCLRPIEHMNEVLTSWEAGDNEKQIGYIATRDDEIGELASHIEKVHTSSKVQSTPADEQPLVVTKPSDDE